MGYFKELSITGKTGQPGASVYIKGFDELERNTNKLLQAVTKHKTAVLEAASLKLKKRLVANTPVGPTGNLRKAAYTKVMPETTSYPAVAFVGFRPKRAPHAHLVEFGHGGPYPAPPHPIVSRTWDEMRDEINHDIEQGITMAVEGAF